MTEDSGLDALLAALKKSGVNVDGVGGQNAGSNSSASSSDGQWHATPGGKNANETGGFSSGGSQGSGNPFMDAMFGGFGGGRSGGGSRGGGNRGDGGDGGGSDEPPIDLEAIGVRMASWSRRTRVLAIIVALFIIYCFYWWFHPPISINSADTWAFVIIFILIPLFLFFRTRSRRYETGDSQLDPDPQKSELFHRLTFIPIGVLCICLVGWVLSWSLFPGNAYKYAHVLTTQQLDFAEDIQEVDYSQIPVIDHDSAELLGNREMGSIPEYVSQFEVDSLYSQINYQGKPVRVSPLGYADLFKWWFQRGDGIPAYALVDMTTQDAEIVRLPEGEGMKYTPSEPLARNIDRYVQLKYPFYIFDEKAFEIDEDGHPWWICPVRSYTIGLFGGETITRVVMCDASTGECIDLPVEEVPEWVDRAYPSDLLIRQYNWSGKYMSGWFNSWLGQSGVVQTTPGTDGLSGYNYIAKDDDVWVYTGVTSATSDSSIVGFVLINQRTSESHYYSVYGATETSAMDSAEGQVQNLRYTATFPLLINVANQPTYFMALKDSAGLVKKFAMVDIQRYQNVAVGDTVADCQKTYETMLATNGVITADAVQSSNLSTATGTIRTMAQAVIDGNTHFYVTLNGDQHIYDFVLPGLIEIVSYHEGDTITFSYTENSPTSTAYEIDSSGGTGDSSASSTSSTSNSSASTTTGDASSSSGGTST